MKIILERNLDFNQFKNVFILNFICFFIFLMLFKSESNQSIINFFGILVLVLICLMLIKKGIVIEKRGTLNIGYFLFGVLIKTTKIETKRMYIISLLTFGKKPNYNYPKRWSNFSRWEPNLEYQAESYQLYLLNESHRMKIKFISFMNEQSSKNAIEFILQNTEMKIEIYNPNKE